MATLQQIMQRAQALRKETAVDSISPERAGGIMYDTLSYINQMQLQDANPILLSKIYSSVEAMEADTAPVSDITGKALRPGQVVVIVTSSTSSPDYGVVYRYNGIADGASSWTAVGKIGSSPYLEGYLYAGIATPSTDPQTENITQRVFYRAVEPGTYTNFGGIVVNSGEVVNLKFDGSSWSKEVTGEASAASVTELGQSVVEIPYNTGSGWQSFRIVRQGGTYIVYYTGGPQLRIYDRSGNYISTTMVSPSTWTVELLKALVYSKTDAAITIINVNQLTKDHVILFANCLDAIYGVLLAYMYDDIERAGFTSYKDFVKDANAISVGNAIGDTASLTPYTSASYHHIIFHAKAGDQIYLCAKGNGANAPIAFVDETTHKILAGSVVAASGNIYACGIYTAPSDCLVVINMIDLASELSQFYLKGITNELFENRIADLTREYEDNIIVFQTGAYIRFGDLTLVERNGDTIYGPYQLHRGDRILISATIGKWNLALAECNADGSSIFGRIALGTVKVGVHSAFSWIATHDCYVLVSPARYAVPDYIRIYRNHVNVSFDMDFIYKELNANRQRLYAAKTGSDLTLGHFSDIHGNAEAVDCIMGLLEQDLFVDDVLNTGDSVTQEFSDGVEHLAAATGWGSILNVIGNHDGAVNNGGYVWNGTPVTDVYNRYIKPYAANWGVVQPANAEANGLCYYYKDYAEKIRLIVLNENYWDAAQLAWFTATLSDARTNGLAVVAVKHSKIHDTESIKCQFNNSLLTVTGLYYLDDARGAVDDFIAQGGTFICWLGGHGHADNVYKYVNNGRLQLGILITTSSPTASPSDTPMRPGYITLFNSIGFDTTNRVIKLLRVGANVDEHMRECRSMCISYDTGDVIYG